MSAIAGIERGFAYQPVHPGLGAQPAEGIVPFKVNRGTLDPRHFPGGDFDELGLEAVLFTPAQVHA